MEALAPGPVKGLSLLSSEHSSSCSAHMQVHAALSASSRKIRGVQDAAYQNRPTPHLEALHLQLNVLRQLQVHVYSSVAALDGGNGDELPGAGPRQGNKKRCKQASCFPLPPQRHPPLPPLPQPSSCSFLHPAADTQALHCRLHCLRHAGVSLQSAGINVAAHCNEAPAQHTGQARAVSLHARPGLCMAVHGCAWLCMAVHGCHQQRRSGTSSSALLARSPARLSPCSPLTCAAVLPPACPVRAAPPAPPPAPRR